MKFEKLNNNKIRILLSSKDMILNNISADNICSDTLISEQFLQKIIYEAEKEIDFKIDDDKLIVEILKNPEGGLIFNISKMQEYNSSLKLIFEFKNFENFLCLCTYIKNMNFLDFKKYHSNFSLALYNNMYYLSISKYCQLPMSVLNALSEFGQFINSSAELEGLINEYGKVLFKENAIREGFKIIKKALP